MYGSTVNSLFTREMEILVITSVVVPLGGVHLSRTGFRDFELVRGGALASCKRTYWNHDSILQEHDHVNRSGFTKQ